MSGKKFSPRLTRPEAGNKYYITKSRGGYSDAIPGNPTDSACNVLANCVGYAYGRFNEIGGYGSCRYLRPVNAENFIQYANGLHVGQTPKLGACMVWRKGATLSSSDGAGHVAIVEKIISPTQIVTSESGYRSSKPFWTQTRNKGNGNWGAGSDYTFLGFIYNPAVEDDAEVSAPVADTPSTGNTGNTGNTTTVNKLKVGDIVEFTGTNHYASASAASGPVCRPGKAKVTALYPSGKHPIHLVRIAGGTSTVYGWVDLRDIKTGEAPTATPAEKPSSGNSASDPSYIPAVGDIVDFTGTDHYVNSMAATPKTCRPGKARITYKANGAKHPYHLVYISGGGSTVYGWVDADTFTISKK